MKVRIPSEALTTVGRAVGDSGLLHLVASPGVVVLSATDGRWWLRATVQAEVEGTGEVWVPRPGLARLLGPVVELERSGTSVVLRGEGTEYRLQTVGPPLPPLLPEPEVRPSQAEVDLTEVGQVGFAASPDPLRQVLTGIHFSWDEDGTLELAATNGYILAALQQPGPGVPCPPMTVPAGLLAEVAQVARGRVQVSYDRAWLKLSWPGYEAGIRLLEGDYPPYRKFLEPKGRWKVVVERAALKAALARVSVLPTPRVTWELPSGTLTATCPDEGTATAVVPCQVDGPGPLTVHFNPRYLSSYLGAVDEPELLVELDGPTSPLIWKAGPRHRFLLMPILNR